MAADKASPPEGILVDDDGTWLVPIVRGWSSRSDADAEAYLIANNRTSEKGGWEERILADVRDADAGFVALAMAPDGNPSGARALSEAVR